MFQPDLLDPTDVLARTLWGEARNQGRPGMEAVAAVIGNRVRNPRWWGHGWLTVCRKPFQFSCWNPGDTNLTKLLAVDGHDPAFVTALIVAGHAMDGTLADPTGGADSYYAIGTDEPKWAAKAVHTVTIGRHAFYRVELGESTHSVVAPAAQDTVGNTDATTTDTLNDRSLAGGSFPFVGGHIT